MDWDLALCKTPQTCICHLGIFEPTSTRVLLWASNSCRENSHVISIWLICLEAMNKILSKKHFQHHMSPLLNHARIVTPNNFPWAVSHLWRWNIGQWKSFHYKLRDSQWTGGYLLTIITVKRLWNKGYVATDHLNRPYLTGCAGEIEAKIGNTPVPP